VIALERHIKLVLSLENFLMPTYLKVVANSVNYQLDGSCMVLLVFNPCPLRARLQTPIAIARLDSDM
jgi:hypothetical protein